MAVDAWEWLSLIDAEGPFLSRAALKSFYPSGLPKADAAVDDVNATFADEFVRWSRAWQTTSAEAYLPARDRWVQAVLRALLDWSDDFAREPAGFTASSPNESVLVTPWAALNGESGPEALVLMVDRTESLRRTGTDGWSANAIDRMAALLRESGVSIGIVTDGRWWALVSATKDVTTASGVWDALLWREERPSRDAFFALANYRSVVGLPAEKKLSLLFAESVASAEQITEALGDQVRRAVELVLQSMSDTHLRALAQGDDSPLPSDPKIVYEGAVTMLMRIVFLLFAEERSLLPEHDLYRSSYAIAEIREKLQRDATATSVEALDHSWEAWHRLLAASNAVYGGASFQDMRMPAYGGSLFEPDRFPWLQSVDEQGRLRIRLTDRAMLAVLRAVQTIEDGAMRLSFRDLDVEQIGYVYEGLLGYSAEYVDEVILGLKGKGGFEPEIPLSELEEIADAAADPADFGTRLTAHLKKTQEHAKPQTANQLAKAFAAADADAEADAHTRLRHALLGNQALASRLVRFHALIRNDLRGFPYVVPDEGLVMTESPQRANTGTHYTPRALAEEVVLHALEPLVYSPGPLDTENRDDWRLKSSAEILDLKVADIAAGSGAFLVAAARYLADRLIEAREREGLDVSRESDLKRWAVREIVARCLYGADVNGMAVEMCKLSLWLISMDPGKPFSFVDDRVFHGNSLLGVTAEAQLKAQHIYPESRASRTPLRWFDVDKDLEDAARIRRELSSGQVDDADRMRSTRAKLALLAQSEQVTAKLREVADGIIAAGLLEGGKPGKKLDDRYDELADALRAVYPADDSEPDRTHLNRILEEGLTPTVDTGESRWKPLHWILEAPDVIHDHGGFDAIIGNPPFLGGKKVTGAIGVLMREWLVHQLAGSATGNADLVAYFFLRAARLLRREGGMGLIATNSVAQGDTRRVGLDQLVNRGATIVRAIQSAPWPSASASLEFAAVWATWRSVPPGVPRVVGGAEVPYISALLDGATEPEDLPARLAENAGVSFIGCTIVGKGFVLEPVEARRWLASDAALTAVVRPFLTGDDISSRPDLSASRSIIDFNDRSESEAQRFELAYERVEREVRPERMKVNRKAHRDRWWQFGDKRPGLRKAISDLNEVLVIARTSSNVMPVRVPTDQTFGDSLNVFATDNFATQAVLCSSFHQLWAITYGGTLETRIRYVASDVFETLPLPDMSSWLDNAGREYDTLMRNIMIDRGWSLTQLTRTVNDASVRSDPGVDAIRKMMVDVDEATSDAYGWADIDVSHGFHEYRKIVRWTVDSGARTQILRRLLEENRRRIRVEQESTPAPRKSTRGQHVGQSARTEGALF